jgi:hypothetical protein
MRRWGLILALVWALLSLASPLVAQNKPCTDAEEKQAERQVDFLRSWDQVYRLTRSSRNATTEQSLRGTATLWVSSSRITGSIFQGSSSSRMLTRVLRGS